MSTPCNSLNVQLIKVSQLANYSALKDADQLMIVENTGGSKFSRNSQLSSLRGYILDTGLSGFPLGVSYNSNTDVNSLNTYTSGGIYTFSHGLGSIPVLIRVVLKCNNTDGSFLIGDEIDITSCFNNISKPLATVSANVSNVKVTLLSFTNAYVYTPSTPTNQLSLNKLSWQIKTYIWK